MRWKSYISSLLICNALAWNRALASLRAPEPAFYFFDVGQGDSELLDLGGVKILMDGGPPNGKAEKALERALPAGDRYLDLVILTHPHLDHWGGLPDIMKRYSIGKFMTDGTKGKDKAYAALPEPDLALGEGDMIRWGGYTLTILGPNASERNDKDPNKASVVALLEGPDIKILYMGDAHAENEDRLRKKYALKADVLKIGHHGSKTSSSQALLDAVHPRYAVISVGRKNRYGHPHQEVVERIKAMGISLFRTDLDGDVEMESDGTDFLNVRRKGF